MYSMDFKNSYFDGVYEYIRQRSDGGIKLSHILIIHPTEAFDKLFGFSENLTLMYDMKSK